jgi:hypothetical protein
MQSMAQKNRKIEPEYLKIAYRNAECDMKLFDSLFRRLHYLIPDRSCVHLQSRLETGQSAVRDNIRNIADAAKEIFSVQTGRTCAVSIKLVSRPPETPEASSKVTAFLRDSDSESRRGVVDDKAYRIDENTAFKLICLDGEPYYVCDDLVAATRSERYLNRRNGWARDYTATIVVPIFKITTPNFSAESQELLGFFCVDNHGGGFEHPDSIRHARELGWRLSVMLYCYGELEAVARLKRLVDGGVAEKATKKSERRNGEQSEGR